MEHFLSVTENEKQHLRLGNVKTNGIPLGKLPLATEAEVVT